VLNSELDCKYDQHVIGEARFRLLYDFKGSSPLKINEGLHYVALKVDDLKEAIRHLGKFQIHPLGNWSNKDRVFLPAEKMFGCLWQLVQI